MLFSFPRTSSFFFFNDTATTEIYTLSLHDALPISGQRLARAAHAARPHPHGRGADETERRPQAQARPRARSEEHTSELQSQSNLVCRLLLEKKKTIKSILLLVSSLVLALIASGSSY